MLGRDSFTRGCAIWAAVLGTAMIYTNVSSAQDVVTGSASVVSSDCGCNTCGTSGGFLSGTGRSFFGHTPRYGSFAEWRAEMDRRHAHYSQISAQVAARNDAWPKPFNCADRQLYFSIWEPMIDAGFERNALLGSQHFNTETNELNDYGKSQVAQIMRNLPTARKAVFIEPTSDKFVDESRLTAVQNSVRTWYGDKFAGNVAMSDRWASSHQGSRFEAINRIYTEKTPPPIIPVASGTGSTSDTQSGQ